MVAQYPLNILFDFFRKAKLQSAYIHSLLPLPGKLHRMLNRIEEAIEDIKQGKLVIVVDDEDRENEGDFITAAHNVTPEVINFMSTHGRGLICAPLTEERCDELNLPAMVLDNTSLHATPFTVSIDL